MRESASGSENLGALDVIKRGRGELVALESANGRVRGARAAGAAVRVRNGGGNVVFAPTYDGRMRAFAAGSGRPLWGAREPAGINACPAVAGDLLVVAAGAFPGNLRNPKPVVDAYAVP